MRNIGERPRQAADLAAIGVDETAGTAGTILLTLVRPARMSCAHVSLSVAYNKGMRVEYLIDGYNLMHALTTRPLRGRGALERARRGLLRWIANRVRDPDSVTVVFDVAPELVRNSVSAKSHQFGLHVLFSAGFENADEMIAHLCQQHSHPKQLIVVSNDHAIQRAARRRRARPLTCAAFEALLLRRAAQPEQRPAPEKPTTPAASEVQYWRGVFENGRAEELSDESTLDQPNNEDSAVSSMEESESEVSRKSDKEFVERMLASIHPPSDLKNLVSDDWINQFYDDMHDFNEDDID